jgi:hypothetical protein
MKLIRFIIKRFIKIEQNMLGRWNTEICSKIVNRKIDLANEDNCGPCGNKK